MERKILFSPQNEKEPDYVRCLTVGENIRSRRKEMQLTQRELSQRTGISEPTIRKYESGRLNPKVQTLAKIAKALECETYILMSEDMAEAYFSGLEEEFANTVSDIIVKSLDSVVPSYPDLTGQTMRFTTEIDQELWELIQAMPESSKEMVLDALTNEETNPPSLSTHKRELNFNATPDPEWTMLWEKLENGTMTDAELQQFKDLNAEAAKNARTAIAEAKIKLLYYFSQLNETGRQISVERLKELTKIPEYQQPQNAAQSAAEGEK